MPICLAVGGVSDDELLLGPHGPVSLGPRDDEVGIRPNAAVGLALGDGDDVVTPAGGGWDFDDDPDHLGMGARNGICGGSGDGTIYGMGARATIHGGADLPSGATTTRSTATRATTRSTEAWAPTISTGERQPTSCAEVRGSRTPPTS